MLPDESRDGADKGGYPPCHSCLKGGAPFGSKDPDTDALLKREQHCAFIDPATWVGPGKQAFFGGPVGAPEHTPWGLLETPAERMPCAGYVRHLPVVVDAYEARANPDMYPDPPATIVEARALLNRAFSTYEAVALRKARQAR